MMYLLTGACVSTPHPHKALTPRVVKVRPSVCCVACATRSDIKALAHWIVQMPIFYHVIRDGSVIMHLHETLLHALAAVAWQIKVCAKHRNTLHATPLRALTLT